MRRRNKRNRVAPLPGAPGAPGGLRHDTDDVRGRLDRARRMLDAGAHDAATREFVWLWERSLGVRPSFVGVRVSFMAGEMRRLVDAHPPARARFEALRNRAGATGAANEEWRADWMVLNRVLGEDQRTVDWYDAVRSEGTLDGLSGRMTTPLVDALLARRRWADVGRLNPDPLRDLAIFRDVLAHTRKVAVSPEHVQVVERWFRDKVGTLLRCLLAAGRTEEAADVRREALALDPSEEMTAALNAAIEGADPGT